jgi:hypothetical protein
MKMSISLRSLLLIAILTVLTGCAQYETSRSEIKLNNPIATPPGSIISTGKTAVIRHVTDERVFEQTPQDASVPSLGFEGTDQATAETKARAIGRKRGRYGNALGDVLLQNGQTAASVIRENLTAALMQAGYEVKNEGVAGPSTLIIDVHIKQFWSWRQSGYYPIILKAAIATDLTISGMHSTVPINGHSELTRHMKIRDESVWIALVTMALDDFRAQVVAKAKTFP